MCNKLYKDNVDNILTKYRGTQFKFNEKKMN